MKDDHRSYHFLLCKKRKPTTTTVYSSNNLCGITGVQSMGSLTKDRSKGECVRLGVLWVRRCTCSKYFGNFQTQSKIFIFTLGAK